MDRRAALVIAAFLAVSGSAFAGYAQLAPPAGWSLPTAEITAPGAMRGGAANAANFGYANGTFTAQASANVGGRAVKVPAAMRMAANAGRFAARYAFGNPLMFAAAAGAAVALPLAAQWFSQNKLTTDGAKWYEHVDGLQCASNCYKYKAYYYQTEWFYSIDAACRDYWTGKSYVGTPVAVGPNSSGGPAPVCHLVNASNGNLLKYEAALAQSTPPYNTSTVREVTQSQMEQRMAPVAVPPGVPEELPIDWPVDDPVVNPDPQQQPQPLRVPMGQPQPVPNSNPQQWKQPAVDLVPAPAPSEPWRVDLQPKDVVSTNPSPIVVPVTPSATDPEGTKTEQTTPDLCEKNPGILACQKPELGDLEPENVANEQRSLTIVPDSGWGASNAACPQPRVVSIQGRSYSIPFDLLCQFATGIRPVVIALAWLSAALMFIGVARKG